MNQEYNSQIHLRMSMFNPDWTQFNVDWLQDKAAHNGALMRGQQAWTGGVYMRPFHAEAAFANIFTVASFVVQSLLLQLWRTFHRKDRVSLLE
jgi:hypothetical protein